MLEKTQFYDIFYIQDDNTEKCVNEKNTVCFDNYVVRLRAVFGNSRRRYRPYG